MLNTTLFRSISFSHGTCHPHTAALLGTTFSPGPTETPRTELTFAGVSSEHASVGGAAWTKSAPPRKINKRHAVAAIAIFVFTPESPFRRGNKRCHCTLFSRERSDTDC